MGGLRPCSQQGVRWPNPTAQVDPAALLLPRVENGTPATQPPERELLGGIARWLLGALGVVALLVVWALILFVPLAALPGDLQTGFVNASRVKLVWGALFLGVFLWRVERVYSSREAWIFFLTITGIVWLSGSLVWINAHGSAPGRAHDMRIVGYDGGAKSVRSPGIKHYKLAEIGSGWRADLESTAERDRFLRRGGCVRIVVRKGRLGLDWISDASPIRCPSSSYIVR